MKKTGILFLILCSILVMGNACRGKTDPISETPAESIAETPETLANGNSSPSEIVFELTEEERKAYEQIKKDKSQ